MVTGGTGKQRLRRDTSLREPPKWRVLILSNGEEPIETKLTASAGQYRRKVRAGQLVRMVDIPAERSPGSAFDGGGNFDPVKFAAAIKRETATHYGTAGPAFVEKLIERGVGRALLRERVGAFVSGVIAGAHGQAERVAERLGVIAVAGELAIEFGITPWPKGTAIKAAQWAFGQWLTKRGGVRPFEERQAMAQVKGIIERFGDSRFDDITTPDPDRRPVADRLGFRRGVGGGRQWLVLPEAWRSEVCVGLDSERVASVLAQRGMLSRSKGALMKQAKVKGVPTWFYILASKILMGNR
jgi:uncharacterized protein (DUF927 family)